MRVDSLDKKNKFHHETDGKERYGTGAARKYIRDCFRNAHIDDHPEGGAKRAVRTTVDRLRDVPDDLDALMGKNLVADWKALAASPPAVEYVTRKEIYRAIYYLRDGKTIGSQIQPTIASCVAGRWSWEYPETQAAIPGKMIPAAEYKEKEELFITKLTIHLDT